MLRLHILSPIVVVESECVGEGYIWVFALALIHIKDMRLHGRTDSSENGCN